MTGSHARAYRCTAPPGRQVGLIKPGPGPARSIPDLVADSDQPMEVTLLALRHGAGWSCGLGGSGISLVMSRSSDQRTSARSFSGRHLCSKSIKVSTHSARICTHGCTAGTTLPAAEVLVETGLGDADCAGHRRPWSWRHTPFRPAGGRWLAEWLSPRARCICSLKETLVVCVDMARILSHYGRNKCSSCITTTAFTSLPSFRRQTHAYGCEPAQALAAQVTRVVAAVAFRASVSVQQF